VFRRYIETGATAGQLLPDPDRYTPPSASTVGETAVSREYNYRIVWTGGHVTQPEEPITRRLAVPLRLPGESSFQASIRGCSGNNIALNQTLAINETIHPSTLESELEWIRTNLDPDADYNYGESRIINSCAPACAPISPRLIPIVLYDPDRVQYGRATGRWAEAGCPSNQPCVRVSNIVGFFIHGSAGGYGPHGHILRYPGGRSLTAPTFVDDASWLVTTQLIR
jgi:hypothetical protein